MKLITVLTTLVAMIISVPLSAAEDDKNPTTITPSLGAGFGKIIEIEGKIVDDTDTRLRSHLGKKLIKVHTVNTRRLAKPVVIELTKFSFAGTKIPVRGNQVKLRGYETGHFAGIPNKAFADIPQVATTNFHFQSVFQVTKRLKPAQVQQK
ncbi:hypothetical protein Pan241w_48460 [Gimesia alba]|uniref:Uncharacterized protein n=1 Tax=Gimesia alba TaxID=2527973 RepID=A0A517RLI0_9PLAN|nr:hypothetical protein [Gimesia alba]QDT44730.1 hypothetical protein Pan241w_48460 [Gimesia alba]